MSHLTILSGAGINLAVSAACPQAKDMLDFTYQKISENVYQRIKPELKALFSPESFDYILGGLLTINLTIEKTKTELTRFHVDPSVFSTIFKQPELQDSIVEALDQIENQLTISFGQQLDIATDFNTTIEGILLKHESINYFTVNFDSVFDHILYGKSYCRSGQITDFWNYDGTINRTISRKISIQHLHGDLRYKPYKKTKYNTPPYRWPVIVVGDQEAKKGIIASNECLNFYHNRLKQACHEHKGDNNILAIIGFGFREEDSHIINLIKHAVDNNTFDTIYYYNPENNFPFPVKNGFWASPAQYNLIQFLQSI